MCSVVFDKLMFFDFDAITAEEWERGVVPLAGPCLNMGKLPGGVLMLMRARQVKIEMFDYNMLTSNILIGKLSVLFGVHSALCRS